MGYFLSDPRPNYTIHQTELYYQSATGNRDKIKLDINCLSRCHVYETVIREACIPLALQAIAKRPIQDFKRQLFPMLKTGYGFVDRDLMTAEAVKCVSRFTAFTENELTYLEEAKKGYYRPELLFEDSSAERIAENPAAKFYITNRT